MFLLTSTISESIYGLEKLPSAKTHLKAKKEQQQQQQQLLLLLLLLPPPPPPPLQHRQGKRR
jgi:hypothetical protein